MVHAKEEMVTIEIVYNGSLLYYHDSTLGIHPDAVRNCTQSRHRTAVSQMTRVMTMVMTMLHGYDGQMMQHCIRTY